jgi:DNA-binding MarR family transcriptional regulator
MSIFDTNSEPLPDRLADALARLAAVARQSDWQAAGQAGLSPTQAEILQFLSRRPAGARLAAAATHAGVRGPTASDAVAALERKGLVGKHADASDGRGVVLKATAAGRATMQHWPASYRPIVSGLTLSEQEALFRLVLAMIRHLHDRKLIAPQRTCITCRHFHENRSPGAAEPHHCGLIGAAMADRHLRIDCPEHLAA